MCVCVCVCECVWWGELSLGERCWRKAAVVSLTLDQLFLGFGWTVIMKARHYRLPRWCQW